MSDLAELPEWKGAPKDDIPLAVAYLLNEAAGKEQPPSLPPNTATNTEPFSIWRS